MNASRHSILALVLWLTIPVVEAQIREADFLVHDRGELWETAKDDGTLGAPNPLDLFESFPSMDWPGGPSILTTKEEQRSYHAGIGLWIGGRDGGGTVFFDELGPFETVEVADVEPIVETENFVETPGYDPSEAEEVIVASFTTTSGLRVQRTSRAWSFRGLNTFVLVEVAVTNETGGSLSDVFVGVPALLRPSYQDINVHNGWGDDFNRTDELVAYDADRALLYAYDDTPNFDLTGDVGNYWAVRDELRTTGYAGVALLDAPLGTGGETQPATVFWAQTLGNELELTTASSTAAALYAILDGTDASLQATPDERLTPLMLLGCGPYALAPGETVRIAFVEAVNGLPLDEAREGLAAQADLPAGLDSLQASIDRAQVLYDAGYAAEAIPPPAPPLEIIPLPTTQEIAISWPAIDQTWADPLTGARITQYNVYRSETGFIGPFEPGSPRRVRVDNDIDIGRFFDAEANVWRIQDARVGLGFSYVYAVTAVDEDGHESWLTNRNADPVTVASSPALDAMNVRVFPNPFRRTSGFPSTEDANSIVFNNLPARATIRIYTSSGELIRTLEHDNPSVAQAVWDQLSDARQRTAPGIYFWTVQSDVGTAQGTLLIIK
ncbi:MAG: hypothetical protein AAGG50_00720 [Bacteroidota bacterium]